MTSQFIDFSSVASLYSQLAGVLAGFAFAALAVIVTSRMSRESDSTALSEAYTPLVCAFFALVASSINYAIMSGEKTRSGRATAVECAAGIGFIAGGCLLIYAMLTLFDGVERGTARSGSSTRRTVRLVENVLIYAAPPLFLTLFLAAVQDHKIVKYGPSAGLTGLDVTAVVAMVAVVGATVLMSALERRHYFSRRYVDRLSVPALVVAISSLFMTGAIFAFVGVDAVVPDIVPIVEILVVVLLGLASAATARYLRGSTAS